MSSSIATPIPRLLKYSKTYFKTIGIDEMARITKLMGRGKSKEDDAIAMLTQRYGLLTMELALAIGGRPSQAS